MNTAFIVWQDPESRHWFPVGKLSLRAQNYHFVYTHGATLSNNFLPFGPMRDLHSVYESEELFPLFANRLLSKSRPEYKDYIGWLNITGETMDPFEELTRTGGIRGTDSLAVVPCPEPQADGTYCLNFFGHGLRYLPADAQKYVDQLQQGRPLYLMLDNQNEQDPLAIAMRTEPVIVVGYVPRYFTEDFRNLLNSKGADTVKVSVQKVNLDAPIQLRLLCAIRSKWPEGFRPCSSELYTPLA